jgi:hypothetical protein
MFVRPAAGHAPHDRQRIIRRSATVLAGARLSDPQFRVMPSAPVDRQDDVAHGIVDIGHDVDHQRAEHLLSRAHRDVRSVPCR